MRSLEMTSGDLETTELFGTPHLETPLEFFFQEQSYSSLHSGQSLAWDHVRGGIDDPCGIVVLHSLILPHSLCIFKDFECN